CAGDGLSAAGFDYW
nr:immunoglobulin heavy chain junction region [Macaca mulatta]